MGTVLSQDEIREITHRERPSAQIRALRRLGIPFLVRADKTPLVSRTAFEQATGGVVVSSARTVEPDFSIFDAAKKKKS